MKMPKAGGGLTQQQVRDIKRMAEGLALFNRQRDAIEECHKKLMQLCQRVTAGGSPQDKHMAVSITIPANISALKRLLNQMAADAGFAPDPKKGEDDVGS
jgi:hypothetical protein